MVGTGDLNSRATPIVPGYVGDKLAELRRNHAETRSGRVALSLVLAERTVEATAKLLLQDEQRTARKLKKRRHRSRSASGARRDPGVSGSSSEAGTESDDEYGLALDTKVRRLAVQRPGALVLSTLRMMIRQVGDDHSQDEAAAAVQFRGLAGAYLTRVLAPQAGVRLAVRAERELRTLAEAMDGLMAGKVQVVLDLLAQRFRAVETSIQSEGGWTLARHLEVIPETKASTVTSGLRAVMRDAERRAMRLSGAPPNPNRKDWEWRKEWNRRQAPPDGGREQLPSAVESAGQPPEKAKGKSKGKGKKGKK